MSGYRWSGDRMRLQEQAAFGPTAMLDSRIRRIGLRTWLAEQFELSYPSQTNPYPNQVLKPGSPQPDCDGNTTVPDVPLPASATPTRCISRKRGFLKKLFTETSSCDIVWRGLWPDLGYVRHRRSARTTHGRVSQDISNNAFGNYRNLMKQMTLNPTMGNYLDMATSTRTTRMKITPANDAAFHGRTVYAQSGRHRSMLEHNPCQTGDTPIPTYDQNVVNNLTKVLTGWPLLRSTAAFVLIARRELHNYIDPMLLNAGVIRPVLITICMI